VPVPRMSAADLPWLGLVAGIALLAWACRLLAADAREGFEVSMGGAMLFSSLWLLGAAACAWSGVVLSGLPWWAGLLAFVALYLLKSAAYRIIVALFLGTAMPEAPKQGGFADFVKRSESRDKENNS